MDLLKFAKVQIWVSAPKTVCKDSEFEEKVEDLVDETRLNWEKRLKRFPGVEVEVEA